jgi:hypothetical protein
VVLAFIIANHLPFQLVERESFRAMIQALAPMPYSISASTLSRELHKSFSIEKHKLATELQHHIFNGGRISLTTDTWSARNYTEHSAITAHWINDNWQQNSRLLDVKHLKEPIHSGEYLSEQLLAATEDYGITNAIFTITRDNATNNTTMLATYEKASLSKPVEEPISVQQPWTFTVKEGDVRCIAHIINLAVQAALTVLKAVPEEQSEAYRDELNTARLPSSLISQAGSTASALIKLRKHIYVFHNRRAWRDSLNAQAIAASIKPKALSLDMPVRWNSTYRMVDSALELQIPITAHCASQTLDMSMRDIQLTSPDWLQLAELRELFLIFVRPSTKMQGSQYPTLNYVIPQYILMLQKLKILQRKVGDNSQIGQACTAAINKLDNYYTLATSQRESHSTIATICDPRYLMNVFKKYWTGPDELRVRRARKQWEDCFAKYSEREHNIRYAAIEAAVESPVKQGEPDSEDELYDTTNARNIEAEWTRWLKEKAQPRDTDILSYWKVKQNEYPTIARIAKDHLAIPASSAPSESVFSHGDDLVTKKRNRLAPQTIRELLFLRDAGVINEADDSDSEL